eukprot:1161816-Pelagomonas_calceolata.AAC.5
MEEPALRVPSLCLENKGGREYLWALSLAYNSNNTLSSLWEPFDILARLNDAANVGDADRHI